MVNYSSQTFCGNNAIAGVRIAELVKKYSTPLLVLDGQEIRNRCREYRSLMEKYGLKYHIMYAGKAMLNMGICRIMEEEGMGLDVVSGGELHMALRAGFPPQDIIFHGNNKSRQEIEEAVLAGLGALVIDNQKEAEDIMVMGEDLGVRVPVMLRVMPPFEAQTHPHLKTGNNSKFGLSMGGGQAESILKLLAASPHIKVRGLHCHIGSQIQSYRIYIRMAYELLLFAAKYPQLWYEDDFILNLGGGFYSSYQQENSSFPLEKMLKRISFLFRSTAKDLGLPVPQLMIEPGRSIVARAGYTIYTLGAPKEIPGQGTIVPVDGGMSDNIRPALYAAVHKGYLVGDHSSRPAEKVSIVGRLCETGDVLIKDIVLPQPKRGDIMVITCTGAYTYPMASNYNGLPRPPVVLIENGNTFILVKGENYEDLIKRQEIPHYLIKKEEKSFILGSNAAVKITKKVFARNRT